MAQCELWTDNVMDVELEQTQHKTVTYDHFVDTDADLPRVAEDPAPYGNKEYKLSIFASKEVFAHAKN